jgi:O-antigen/teichoic acid export membrane protein
MIARCVGPNDFGRYSYCVTVVGVLIVLTNNGLTTSGIRFISELIGRSDREGANAVHAWLARCQWFSIALFMALFAAATPLLLPSGWALSNTIFAALVIVCFVAKAMSLFELSIAKGYRLFKLDAQTSMVVNVLTAIAVIVMYFMQASLLAFLILFAISCLAYWGVAIFLVRKHGIRAGKFSLDSGLAGRVNDHLRWSIVLTFVAALSNKSIETYLLNRLASPSDVAFFSIAAALTRGGVDLLSSALSGVLMPTMAHAYGAGGQHQVGPILGRSARYFHFLGLMLAGVGIFVAAPAIDLMYGARFEPTINVMRVMVMISGLTLSEGAFASLLSITDHQRARAMFAGFSVTVNAIAAIVLIPPYGLQGALYAHVIARVLSFSAIVIASKHILPTKMPVRALVGLTLAAALSLACAGLFAWQVRGDIAQGASAALFGILFLVLTVKFQAWDAADARLLLSLIDHLPRRARVIRTYVERWEQRLIAANL